MGCLVWGFVVFVLGFFGCLFLVGWFLVWVLLFIVFLLSICT